MSSSPSRLKVLLIIEQCNPEWASVPLVGYQFYQGISQQVDATLVTHERNRAALEKVHSDQTIHYILEANLIKQYYRIAARLSKFKGRTLWPIHHTLTYPIYNAFSDQVYHQFKNRIIRGEYHIVHAITPMMPRYPVKTIAACVDTPFILGPVNGGVPYPQGFADIARREFSGFNVLRSIGRWVLPGYRTTYEKADRILAGSTYTLALLKDLFQLEESQIELFYENGIDSSFLRSQVEFEAASDLDPVKLLFVGRLVPYKGADMLIEAVGQLDLSVKPAIQLTIIGDGSERGALEQRVQELDLVEQVQFTGWIQQQDTLGYYRSSDIFCFPSIREFGGAVVLEALANGLPCIVANHGGIGEYVTPETGYRIDPLSRTHIIQEMKHHIEHLVLHPAHRQAMSLEAIQRAKAFTWDLKAEKIVAIYQSLLND